MVKLLIINNLVIDLLFFQEIHYFIIELLNESGSELYTTTFPKIFAALSAIIRTYIETT